MDTDSLAIAESLVALSKPSIPSSEVLKASNTASSSAIPIRSYRKHSIISDDEFLGEDCSPCGVDQLWRPRLDSEADSYSSYCDEYPEHLDAFNRIDLSSSPSFDSDSSMNMTRACRSLVHSANTLLTSPVKSTSYVGSYSPEARRRRIERFLAKRKRRVWSKKVDYDVRKNFADSRLRVKGRFVKKEDEALLCQLISFT